MKSVYSLIVMLVAIASVVVAQDTTATAKFDTLLVHQMKQKILEKNQYVPPLTNKWAGIELDLARILVSTGQDYFTFPGTFSLFDVTRLAEIAFPFFIKSGTSRKREGFDGTEYDVPLTLINLDATYRHFLGKYQEGFYFSVGMRYTYIKGLEGDDFIFFPANRNTSHSSTHKFGVYFGVGYRYFTESGFYWGVSLIYGRYFGGERDYQEVLLDDKGTIIDVEILKFGFAF